jgi:hypothetical protein
VDVNGSERRPHERAAIFLGAAIADAPLVREFAEDARGGI